MSLALSEAEIMCNSQADLRATYDQWVRVSNADPASLKPIPIEMGKGNSKVTESTGSRVCNPVKFNHASNNTNTNSKNLSYLPEHVKKQNMGIEKSQDPLFDSEDDDLLYISESMVKGRVNRWCRIV